MFIGEGYSKNSNGFEERFMDAWYSDRRCPLVTQPSAVLGVMTPLITVERYCKWYDLYYIESGQAKTNPVKLSEVKTLPPFYDWVDHSPKPKELVRYCIKNGLKMELQVYYAIATRWSNDIAESGMLYTSDFGVGTDDESYIRDCLKSYNPEHYPTKEELEQVLFDPGEVSLIN